MCGIIGILGAKQVEPLLMDSLKRLEYRGYDSAGVASLVEGRIERRRAEGKIANLEVLLKKAPLPGTAGIGHTRWATHGRPTESNAHPHSNGRVALVHNGIIENFRSLRKELEANQVRFETETDTEVILHMIDRELAQGRSPQQAVAATLKRLHGAFALAILFADHPDLMIGARQGSPLAVGFGDGEVFLGSDALALAPLTDSICYLEEGDWVVLRKEKVEIFDQQDRPVERTIGQTEVSGALIGKGQYDHFMLKEIYEQPAVVGDTLNSLIDPLTRAITLPQLHVDFTKVSRMTIVACGTASLAGLVAKYWIEQVARLPVEVDVASEFRYREAPLPDGGVSLFITQSGETIDTLAALRYARSQGQTIISLVNQPESAIARESDAVLVTRAGPEIGVASTKAFTTQLAVLACLAIAIARDRGVLERAREKALSQALIEVPALIAEALTQVAPMQRIAAELSQARDVLYLGRGSLFPLALEGALKLKEISYIHAEGYAAGEMKHGPIALIDEQVPVIVCAPSGPLFQKTASNVQEVIARGGRVILLTDAKGAETFGDGPTHVVILPDVDPFVAPLLFAIPIQQLAYYTALLKGTDVDQPRNLAKSVTVE